MPKSFIVEAMGRRLEVVQDDDGKFVVPVGFRGLGGALKPAFEPALLFRKPLAGTVAENVMAHGTGALNISACRVPTDVPRPALEANRRLKNNTYSAGLGGSVAIGETSLGRFPANLILSYNEDEFELRPGVTAEQKKELLKFLYENT